MPVNNNQIGALLFDAMTGALDLPAEKLELFTRPGIDGYGARQTGSRPEPTTIRTVRYVLSWADARAAMLTYQAIAGGDPVGLEMNGVDYVDYHRRGSSDPYFRKLKICKEKGFLTSYCAEGGFSADTFKMHGPWEWYTIDWEADFMSPDRHNSGTRFYWYGEEITEGEWHLRNK